MEAKSIARVVVVAVMIFLLVGQSSASVISCFIECMHMCKNHKSEVVCVPLCFAMCVPIKAASDGEVSCANECVKSSCLELDSEGDAMQDCLHNCANCTKPIPSLETKP